MKRVFYFTTLICVCTLWCSCEKEPGTGTDIPIPDNAIDLGIVITREDGTMYKLYWSDCNLGASKPTGSGDYFAWGETKGKQEYTWETYKWREGDKITKYCSEDIKDYWGGAGKPDGIIVLDPEDDAAHVILGGKWRIPTKDEWAAMKSQCKIVVGHQPEDGVVGILVEGNKKSIFLPFTGVVDENGLHNRTGDNDGYGKLCIYSSSSSASSSLITTPYFSSVVAFIWQSRTYPDGMYTYRASDRYIGHPIRPVWEELVISE